MTVLLLTIGSAGDVHPFVGIGRALQHRGHRVRVIVNPFFSKIVQDAGLEHIPLGTADDFISIRENPDLWHRRRGLPTVIRLVANGLRPTYQAIVENHIPGETVIVASSLGFAARIAQDKLALPLATVHLQPAVIRSAIKPPKLPGLFLPDWLPTAVKRGIFAAGDWAVLDRIVGPPLNQFRAEMGLPPVRGILNNWWHSPLLTLGLFPDWFAPPQTDWPPQIQLTGFPLFDESSSQPPNPHLQQFLDTGPPPLVFTPGSAMHHAHDFFRQSVQACLRLNQRGILLTSHAAQIPDSLPPIIKHFSYIPFSEIFPRAAAVIHHGGIGTSAQAMAAAARQLIVPFTHDQLDNAHRMRQLGIAVEIHPHRYQAKQIAKTLENLLQNQQMTVQCKTVAQKFTPADWMQKTCELIEGLLPLKN